MCARRVAHFSPRRGRLASSSTGCNRTAATNCKLSAGRPGETGPIRHHFYHLHHRPPSIILRVICSALLRESKKKPAPAMPSTFLQSSQFWSNSVRVRYFFSHVHLETKRLKSLGFHAFDVVRWTGKFIFLERMYFFTDQREIV